MLLLFIFINDRKDWFMAKIEPFEKYTEKYEKWFDENEYVYKSEVKAIREILPVFKNGVEIGVGSGKFAKPLGIKYGLEPSCKMRNIAKSIGIKTFDGIAEDLPFKDNIYDVVLMVTTLCFLDDVDKAFKEVCRVLKKGGFFINGFVDRESKVGKIYQLISRFNYPELYQVRFDNQDEMEIFLPHGLEKENRKI